MDVGAPQNLLLGLLLSPFSSSGISHSVYGISRHALCWWAPHEPVTWTSKFRLSDRTPDLPCPLAVTQDTSNFKGRKLQTFDSLLARKPVPSVVFLAVAQPQVQRQHRCLSRKPCSDPLFFAPSLTMQNLSSSPTSRKNPSSVLGHCYNTQPSLPDWSPVNFYLPSCALSAL